MGCINHIESPPFLQNTFFSRHNHIEFSDLASSKDAKFECTESVAVIFRS